MKLAQIYEQFTRGSQGFCIAVETHCGFGISRDEIKRIADVADTAAMFEATWQATDWWTDAKAAA